MKIDFKIVLLFLAYMMNFFHDLHPHSHSEETQNSQESFLCEIVDLFSHEHEENETETDDNNDDNNDGNTPFHHTHLLQGHTLLSLVRTVAVQLTIQCDYLISNVSEAPLVEKVRITRYITDSLILYDTLMGMSLKSRAPPHIFNPCLS